MNPIPVDITTIMNASSDFHRLVEEMNRTHVPRVLTRENKTVAMLMPATTNVHELPSPREYQPEVRFGENVIDLETHTDIEEVIKIISKPRQKSNLLAMSGVFKGPKDLSRNKKKYAY